MDDWGSSRVRGTKIDTVVMNSWRKKFKNEVGMHIQSNQYKTKHSMHFMEPHPIPGGLLLQQFQLHHHFHCHWIHFSHLDCLIAATDPHQIPANCFSESCSLSTFCCL